MHCMKDGFSSCSLVKCLTCPTSMRTMRVSAAREILHTPNRQHLETLHLDGHKKMIKSKVLQVPKVSEDFIIVVLGVLLSLEVAGLYLFYQVINDDQ